MSRLVVTGGAPIGGEAPVPGDKSISHRALMLAAAGPGASTLRGLATGADVASTRACLQAYGAVLRDEQDTVTVHGRPVPEWTVPDVPMDCGNSGTTMRLLAGFAARISEPTILDGDASLRRRPMDRIAEPLRRLGASVETSSDGRPPITVRGGDLRGTQIHTGVASAQVKSSALLAALGATGSTTVIEPAPTRDHTERMLQSLGAPISMQISDGSPHVTVEAFNHPCFDLQIPGDPSSAAFLVAAAVLRGHVSIPGVALNPLRIAFLQVASRMGADVQWSVEEHRLGEPVGHVEARGSRMHGTGVEGPIVPALIDELPLLAILATQADGDTVVRGAAELRVKESDRIDTLCEGLSRLGADIDALPDGFVVRGPTGLRGDTVDSHGDHRIAMALAVAALVADGRTTITGWEASEVSWPGFADVLTALGGSCHVEET